MKCPPSRCFLGAIRDSRIVDLHVQKDVCKFCLVVPVDDSGFGQQKAPLDDDPFLVSMTLVEPREPFPVSSSTA